MRYSAWLVFDAGSKHACALADISESGARIDIETSEVIPDRFVLLLSDNGAAKRKCGVIWREPTQIGVAFERPLAATERATLVPALKSHQAC